MTVRKLETNEIPRSTMEPADTDEKNSLFFAGKTPDIRSIALPQKYDTSMRKGTRRTVLIISDTPVRNSFSRS